MKPKSVVQNFSNFKGLDVKSSELTRPPNFSKEIKNFEILPNFSLVGRRGSLPTSSSTLGGCQALITLNDKDLESGESSQKLLAIGASHYVWRMKSEYLRISNTTNAWDYSCVPTATGYEFKLWKDVSGTLTLAGTKNLGDGLGIWEGRVTNPASSPFAITQLSWADFVSWFGGIAGFLASVSNPTDMDDAIAVISPRPVPTSVSGFTPVSTDRDIPIDFFYYTSEDTFAEFLIEVGNWLNRSDRNQEESPPPPASSVNLNNKVYITLKGESSLLSYDGQRLRRAGMPAAYAEDYTVAVASGGSLTGRYRYYVRPFRFEKDGQRIYGSGFVTDIVSPSSQKVTIAINTSTYKTDMQRGIRLPVTFTRVSASGNFTNYSWNLATSIDQYLSDLGFPPLRIGSWLCFRDGSINRHHRITAIDKNARTMTVWGNGTASANPTFFLSYLEWGLYSGKIANTPIGAPSFGLQAALGSGTVSAGQVGHSILVSGHVDVDLALTTAANQGKELKITDATGGKLSGTFTNYNGTGTPNSSPYVIWADWGWEIWRTENGGNSVFYKCADCVGRDVLDSALSPIIFRDSIADASLGEELVFPELEPDVVPYQPSIVTEHQGRLVVGGFKDAPNTIFWEDLDSREGFPLDSNYATVPSQESGAITALWSDGYDQLAVFKPLSFSSLVGELGGQLTLEKRADDQGVSSQASLVRAGGFSLGICPVGFTAFQAGQIDRELTKFLRPDFVLAQRGLNTSEATILRPENSLGVNDTTNQRAIFFVPALTHHTGSSPWTYDVRLANSNSKVYIFDYSEKTWGRYSFAAKTNSDWLGEALLPSAGMTMLNGELYTASSCLYLNSNLTSGFRDSYAMNSVILKRLGYESSNYAYDYNDACQPIEYDMYGQWEYGDSPSVDKTFESIKIFMLQASEFIPFSLRVRTYRNWDTSTVIDDRTVTFSTASDFERIIKLKATKARCMLFRFTTSSLNTKPTITGYEYYFGSDFKEENQK